MMIPVCPRLLNMITDFVLLRFWARPSEDLSAIEVISLLLLLLCVTIPIGVSVFCSWGRAHMACMLTVDNKAGGDAARWTRQRCVVCTSSTTTLSDSLDLLGVVHNCHNFHERTQRTLGGGGQGRSYAFWNVVYSDGNEIIAHVRRTSMTKNPLVRNSLLVQKLVT